MKVFVLVVAVLMPIFVIAQDSLVLTDQNDIQDANDADKARRIWLKSGFQKDSLAKYVEH